MESILLKTLFCDGRVKCDPHQIELLRIYACSPARFGIHKISGNAEEAVYTKGIKLKLSNKSTQICICLY